MKNFIVLIYLCFSLSAFGQGIPLTTNFTMNTALPLDDRFVHDDLASRDAIPELRRYYGMIVYVRPTVEFPKGAYYRLEGNGLTNADWVEFSSGSGGGVSPFEPEWDYLEHDVIIHNNKLYEALADFESGLVFDPVDWFCLTCLPPHASFESVTTEELTISDLNTENGVLFTDINGKVHQLYNFRLNPAGNLQIPASLFAKNFVIGGLDGNEIFNADQINLSSQRVTFDTNTRARSDVGSNNYDVENLAKYPNFLEGSTDQYTCLACTPSIVVGGGVIAGTNSLKITHTTTSQLTFEAPTSGQLGQYVTLTMSVKTDTITHIVPVSDTVGDITNQWIISPSTDFQTVTITYPMGATSTGFFVIPQDGGETEISQVHLKRAEDNTRWVRQDADNIDFPLTLSGTTNATITQHTASRIGNRVFYSGQIDWTGAGTTAITLTLPSGLSFPLSTTSSRIGSAQGFNLSGLTGSYDYTLQSNGVSDITFRALGVTGASSGILNLRNGINTPSAVNGTSLRFNFQANIEQWSMGNPVTRLDCAIGDLRCTNLFTATVNADRSIASQENGVFLTSVTSGGTGLKINNFVAGLFSVPPKCWGELRNNNIRTQQLTIFGASTTQVTAYISNAANETDLYGYTLFCERIGTDRYNAPNDVLSCENVISANEVKCGRDDINNKPVYRRTVQTTSAVTNSTVNVAIIATGLSLKNFVPYDTNVWQYALHWESGGAANAWRIYYNDSTGNLSIQAGSSQTVRAGLQIPLIYTKP